MLPDSTATATITTLDEYTNNQWIAVQARQPSPHCCLQLLIISELRKRWAIFSSPALLGYDLVPKWTFYHQISIVMYLAVTQYVVLNRNT